MGTQKHRVTLSLEPEWWQDILERRHHDPEFARKAAADDARRWMSLGFALRHAGISAGDDRMIALLTAIGRMTETEREPVEELIRKRLQTEARRRAGRRRFADG